MSIIKFVLAVLFIIFLFVGLLGNSDCCPCGASDGCCPCPNVETLHFFKENCKDYNSPSSAGSWYDECHRCNEKLNKSMECWKE